MRSYSPTAVIPPVRRGGSVRCLLARRQGGRPTVLVMTTR